MFMNVLFTPAIALMNRLRYPKKFALLGAVALVAILMLQVTLYLELSKVIEPSRQELVGLSIIKPLNGLVSGMQQHRGLSSGVLSGNEGLKDRRAGKEKEVAGLIVGVEAKLPASVRDSQQWRAVRSDWDDIQKNVLSWTAPESFTRHTRMIDQALTAMIAVADSAALTLDPDIDSYYLMDTVVVKMPSVLERLGQLRARGTGLLAKKEITDQQKTDLSTLIGELQGTQRLQKNNIDKVMAYAPGTRSALERASQDFDKAVVGALDLVKKDILGGLFETNSQEYFNLTTKLIDQGYVTMYEILMPSLEKAIQARIKGAETQLYLTFAVTVGVALAFAYFAIGAYLSMIASVKALGDSAEKMASGDLTERVRCAAKDELDDVAGHFNHMAESMQALLRLVQNTASNLGAAATDVTASAARVSKSSEEQTTAASGMAAAIEEMSVGIDQIAEHAQTAYDISTESGKLSEEGSQIVDGTVSEMQKIADTVNQSAGIIEELGRHSENISAIVGVIKEIADQTNLLALNAAIEAARAGEQGRGFAVVADEVRKLAERTTSSTQEISGMIGAIQSGTAGAVASMQAGVARVADGVDLSRRAGESISRIKEGANRVRTDVNDISHSLREQSSASNEIARNVEHIAQMSEANSSAVQGTLQTARELERLATELQNEVRRFRV
jgi:methyl-accepting chemotaxis protein